MLTARQKRKENIAEYILYLFQVEDLIRAYHFDIELIKKHLVSQYKVDEKTRDEITGWYENLAKMMEKEGIRDRGHLQFLINQINEVNEFHLKLMEMGSEGEYLQNFGSISGLLSELNRKNNARKNDLQICLDAVYGFLLLKMQKKEITNETFEAIKQLSSWLGSLSVMFKKFEAGDLEIE